jgi:hypothetical protein
MEIENIITIIVSSVLSGILATVITLAWQNKSEKVKMKREIFTTLMAYRFNIANAESVKALNCVQVVFYNNEDVRNAWKKFKTVADTVPFIQQNLIDAHISLLEEIAKDLKYNNINWTEIKSSYYPEAIAEEINESKALRKAQLQVVLSNVNQSNANNTYV